MLHVPCVSWIVIIMACYNDIQDNGVYCHIHMYMHIIIGIWMQTREKQLNELETRVMCNKLNYDQAKK